MSNYDDKNTKSKPPYLLGLMGIIPLVGFFIGLGLFLYGIFKHKDKKLIIIGFSCMLYTVLVYSALFYFGFNSDEAKQNWAQMTQLHINGLVDNIEYYKTENNVYPNSLQQLKTNDKFIFIDDPLRINDGKKTTTFNYKNLGKNYLLFSAGIDGIPNTKDDIYPQTDSLNKNIGWKLFE
jgi:ABC-type transport system involved in multi-copper enzyme maturation permease subunit